MPNAVLTNKRLVWAKWERNPSRYYVVDVTCSECGYCSPFGFGYWSAVLCFECGTILDRTRYRRPQ